MARHIAIFALVAFCLSSVVAVEPRIANREFLERQKWVYELMWHVDQPEMQPEHYAIAKSYDIEAHLADYTHEEYVREFLRIYKAGMLHRGEIFSPFYPAMLDQAVALFRVFYYSKDFDTLYKTAAWARIHVNEGLFVYAFSVAVTHHKDTQHIRVPAYHEIYPHLYFDDGVIREACNAKASTVPEKEAFGDWTIIHRNYSFPYGQYSDYELSYFTGDIAVNDLPYYAHLINPFWMSADEYELISERRGEAYLWLLKSHLVRYYFERLSNDLGDIKDFDWDQRIPYGFIPNLSYHNGYSLPHREGYSYIPDHKYEWLQALRDYEYRISAAIDMGYVVLENGTFFPIHTSTGISTLGNLIEGNVDSVNFGMYGSYDRVSRNVLGFGPEPLNDNKVFPSIMEQYGLDQRDPIFWSLVKRVAVYWERFVSKLPKYTSQELAFDGVKIESVSVDKITTYFTYYDYFISGAVKLYNAADKALIKARQNRLTHKPYTYTMKVSSTKDVYDCTMRIFMGPKEDFHGQVIDITENWKHFILIDEFPVNLTTGVNEFHRRSTDAYLGVPDEFSGDIFYEKILSAIAGNETYEIPEHLYGYPERMFIPKGKKEGFPMQFFFFISPHSDKESSYRTGTPIFGTKHLANVPAGYPLDRPSFFNLTELANAYFKDVNIYHVADESELNVTF